MINFMKKWKGTLGTLEVEQVASPSSAYDGAKLHVTTLFRPGGEIHAGGSVIEFEDVEKLGDDAFRLALARAAAKELLLRLRRGADAIEAALAASTPPATEAEVERAYLERAL